MMMDQFTDIRTQRLLLRQFEQSDIHHVFRGLSDKDVIRYYGVSYDSLEATQEQMRFFESCQKERTGIWWAVCSHDDTLFYGAGGLNSMDERHKKAEIGFWLLKDFWRQGIMTEALPLICRYGFEQLRLHRIEGFVESENLNCKKAMDKLGFSLEGTMVDCEIKNGRFISLDVYSRLESDE